MENSIYYNTKAINFIRILNYILLSFVALVLILVLTLSINDTVPFTAGEIYSNTPQMKITAPNEVRVLQVNVREGSHVKKGDTLFMLENKRVESDYNILKTDIAAMENKIEIIKKMITNSVERRRALKQLLKIQGSIYKTGRKKTEHEIKLLNDKIKLASQQSSLLTDKYRTDSLLYAKGAISKFELQESKSRNIDTKKGNVDISASQTVKNYDYENLTNNFQLTKNDLRRTIIDVENEIANYERQILELDNAIKDGKHNMEFMTDELDKMVITSPMDGTVSNLFNSRQNTLLVPKGEILGIVAPSKEAYYAKVTLNERDLAYVRKGQDINLKLDAYNYYRYGAVKGKITYVSPSDVNMTFYCLASIEDYNPNINLRAGYKLKGEVIIERMKLYKYIMKKLFNKLDRK